MSDDNSYVDLKFGDEDQNLINYLEFKKRKIPKKIRQKKDKKVTKKKVTDNQIESIINLSY